MKRRRSSAKKNPKTALSSSGAVMKRCSSSVKKKGLMSAIEKEKKLESSAEKEGLVSEIEIEREKKLGLKCTVTQINREKKETVYAVFETDREDVYGGEYEYLIYKLDSSAGAQELVMPIETLKPGKYPLCMSFFSVGSRFYFIGGTESDDETDDESDDESDDETDDESDDQSDHGIPDFTAKPYIPGFTAKAYMFDTNSNQGTIEINSMNCPKPGARIFGPVDDYKFYVFAGSHPGVGDGGPSFEVLDTYTNTWESLELPNHLSGVSFHTSSALCGSNILICDSSGHCLYVFCIRTGIWRQIDWAKRNLCEPYNLPFLKARPLFHGKAIGQVFLASQSFSDFPEVYSSPNLPPVMNEDGEDYDPVGPFEDLGEVEDPMNLLNRDGWGNLVDFYCFKDKICLFRFAKSEYKSSSADRFAINICDVTYFEGHDVKVKVKNTLQFTLSSNYPLDPMHVHVVA